MDVRKDFPILQRKINGKPLVYLDNAATSQKPTQVIDAITDFYTNHCGSAGRGAHTLTREASEMYEDARKKVASFIGAKPEEIVFTRNTTDGLNRMVNHYCFDFGKFDEIVTTVMEHHSNYLPWRRVCEKTRAKLKVVDIRDDGSLDMKDYEKRIGGRSTIAAVTHVSNVLGTINPVKEMAKMAHENGALFILDGAQSVPHMKVDVKKLDCDFMAFSGHKMLGPTGIGILYGRADLLEGMSPSQVGGGMVERINKDIKYLDAPNRFESGTPNVAGAVGLGAAVDYLNNVGMDKIGKHEKGLTKNALDNLNIETYGPEDRAGIISFNLGKIDPGEICNIMDENGVMIRSGHHCAQPLMRRLGIDGCARISFYLYNTKEEVDYAINIINKIRNLA